VIPLGAFGLRRRVLVEGCGARWELTAMVDPDEVLSRISLFSEVLDPDQIARLGAKCHSLVFSAGSLLMTEGDFGTSMFALVEGKVAVTFGDRRGKEHDVAELGAGDIVGEMSLMTGARRRATVTAITEVVALEITKVALEEILARAPDLIDSFGAILTRRQAELSRAAAEAERSDNIVVQIGRFFGIGK
jgi:CRP-like cAMP-binding protein